MAATRRMTGDDVDRTAKGGTTTEIRSTAWMDRQPTDQTRLRCDDDAMDGRRSEALVRLDFFRKVRFASMLC